LQVTVDLHQLRAFAAIADAGSLGRAAAILGVTQPALSRLVARTESQFGVALFERLPTGMCLTVYGESLLPRARLLLAEASQALEDIAAIRGLSKGVVRVGAVAGANRVLLPKAIARILARWPGLRVQLSEGSVERLCTALANRSIDLMVASNISGDQDIERVMDTGAGDEWAVVAASDHPLTRIRTPSLRSVVEERWVMPALDSEPRQHLERILRGSGMEMPDVVVETRATGAMLAMVAQSRYLSWLPRPLFSAEQKAGSVRSLEVQELCWRRSFSVYRRRGGLLPAAALKLLDELDQRKLVRPRAKDRAARI
jgi:DNA-binding transcriptional LysR family regulator